MTWTPPAEPRPQNPVGTTNATTTPDAAEGDVLDVEGALPPMTPPLTGISPRRRNADGELERRAVTLEIPSSEESMTMARTVATCLAADAGLNVCEIDDVRLALDEVLSTLVDQTDGTIRMYFTRLDNGLQAALSVVDGADVVVPKSAMMIMNALVDDVSFAGNYAIFTKRKQR